jgi:predicted Holliday junction resolvase-like endonuclease
MKDRLDTQFKIVDEAQSSTIRKLREEITELQSNIRDKNAAIQQKINERDSASSEEIKTTKQEEIDRLQSDISGPEGLNEKISSKSKDIERLIDNGEISLNNSQRTTSLTMPELKTLIETKRTEGDKTITRIHIYDSNSKPNELESFLSNLEKTNSLTIDSRDDWTVTDAQDAINNLIEVGDNVASLIDIPDQNRDQTDEDDENTETSQRQRLVVNLRSKYFKKAVKASMPSITYGTAGTSINKVAINGMSDPDMQSHYLLQTQTGDHANTSNESPDTSNTDAQRLMPVNITLDMMGCPLLRYGQEYFIDLGTNTDLDNVYMMTKITHNISAGTFTTRAEMKPIYSSAVSFSSLLSDIYITSNPIPIVVIPPADQTEQDSEES